MTKAELVAVMAKSSGGSKTAAERALQEFVCAVFEALRKGQKVTISGFGTFVVARRAGREVRDPRTGKRIKIPPAKVPRFRPSRGLKAVVK